MESDFAQCESWGDLWFDNGRGSLFTLESVGVSAKKMDVIGAIFSPFVPRVNLFFIEPKPNIK